MPKKLILEETVKKIKKGVKGQFYHLITPEDKEWEIISQLQELGKLPRLLYQVYVWTKKRQYERGVMEMEHIYNPLEVKLMNFFPYSISPRYWEDVKHYTCYNPHEGRLHVLLERYESLDDLSRILQKGAFTPLKFFLNKHQQSRH